MRKSAILFFLFLCAVPCVSLWAGQYDIRQMTPEVQTALQGRQNRYGQLQALKSSGVIGENNRGYVEVLQASGEGPAASENNDRRVIYAAIVQQNGLGPDGLVQVEKAFASVQRTRAKAGEHIQAVSGEWKEKQEKA